MFLHIFSLNLTKKYNQGEQIKAKDLKYFYMKGKVAADNIGQPDSHPLLNYIDVFQSQAPFYVRVTCDTNTALTSLIRGLTRGELRTLLKHCLAEVKTQHFSKNITAVQDIMTMLQTECKFGMHQGKFLAYFERDTQKV